MATVVGEVRNSGLFRTRSMPIFQLTVGQGGSQLRCLWFNATYLQDKFKPGQMIALYGKVEADQRTANCRSSSRNSRFWATRAIGEEAEKKARRVAGDRAHRADL